MEHEHTLLLPLLILLFSLASGSLDSDLNALSDFRLAADQTGSLTTWNNQSDPNACNNWLGVTCSSGRVTRLVLENLNLTGSTALPVLVRLDQLRVLSLKWNQLNGPIPDLSPLSGLKLLFLSHNYLSGSIPGSVSTLNRLYRLDLSFNNLSGLIPAELNRLNRLLTLRLDSNRLTGPVTGIVLPKLQDFNISNNLLAGEIPATLAAFPAAAFEGNVALCGAPLLPCKDVVSEPTRPTNATATAAVPPVTAVVASSPSAKPAATKAGGGRISKAAVVAIVAGDFALVGLVAALLFCYFWPRINGRRNGSSRLREGEKIVYSSSPYGTAASSVAGNAGGGGFERGKMVFLNDMGNGGGRRFELEDLLRASAEMLGKGGYGTAYKAVLDDGSVVAVKRLRDAGVGVAATASAKREFEHHMDVLGRLQHPNIVPLIAYYYGNDEKLLVYEFMPNGSLFALLHGNRGPGRTPLDWSMRMRIATGAARGLAHIHHVRPKLAHGNIKSSNVLLDKSGNAGLADCGLAQLGSSPSAAARSTGYRAPEAPPHARPWATQKGDVYAFGVLLLELLTGRMPLAVGLDDGIGTGVTNAVELPRWVQSVVREEWTAEVFDLELMKDKGIEEDMVAMLQLALSCTAMSPDQRPKIAHVVKAIDEVRANSEASPSHDSFDGSAVSDSPSVSVSEGATSQ